jgi:uncharacterized membrane protein YedE/YeeE
VIHLFPDRLAWYIAGPAIGLLIVMMYAIANQPFGVVSSYGEIVNIIRGRPGRAPWRLWFFAGLAAGAFLAATLRGGPTVTVAYGALGRLLPCGLLAFVLFIAGAAMGYGARWGGGCTSGHGLTGNAALSPASLVATLAFMATAVGITMLLHVATGGAL